MALITIPCTKRLIISCDMNHWILKITGWLLIRRILTQQTQLIMTFK